MPCTDYPSILDEIRCNLDEQIIDLILQKYASQKINLLAPIVKGRKGHYRELFEDIRKRGFNKVRIDGVIVDITPKMQVDRYKIHDIEIVIDRLEITADITTRLNQSLQTAILTTSSMLVQIMYILFVIN